LAIKTAPKWFCILPEELLAESMQLRTTFIHSIIY